MKRLLPLMLLLLSSFTPRDKSIKDAEQRKKILTTGRWLLVDNYASYTVNGQVIKHSKWQQLDTCFKDNTMGFRDNGKVYYGQGAIKCHKTMPDIDSSFRWRLDNAEDMLWLESTMYTQPLHIEYISDSVLEINEFYAFQDSAFIKVYRHIVRKAGY